MPTWKDKIPVEYAPRFCPESGHGESTSIYPPDFMLIECIRIGHLPTIEGSPRSCIDYCERDL
jgi:hypothetical protein